MPSPKAGLVTKISKMTTPTSQHGHRITGAVTNFGNEITGNNFSAGGNNIININSNSSKAEERKKCLHMLFVTDPTEDRARYISFRGRAVPGTCSWLLRNQRYKDWVDLSTKSKLIWLSGAPGMGKTMLSVFLTEELERSKSTKAVLLYYFCEGRDAKRNTAVNILRGLIYSLICQRSSLIKHLLPYFEVREEALFQPSSIEAMWAILECMIQDPDTGPVYCVIDGLDECSQGSLEHLEHILKKIRDFYLQHSRNADNADSPQGATIFKMALLSREDPQCLLAELSAFPRVRLGGAKPSPDPTIDEMITKTVTGRQSEAIRESRATTSQVAHIPATITEYAIGEPGLAATADTPDPQYRDSSAGDYLESLSIYIEAKVNKLADSKGYDDTLRASLKNTFSQRGNGTFLWIDMAIDQLNKMKSKDTQETLNSLPDGLEEIYCRMLLQIPQQHISVASFVIRWVTTAFRPLTIEELNVMLYFLNREPSGPILGVLQDAIISCGNLLAINEKQEISLAHQTTKDFLTADSSPLLSDARLQQFHVKENQTHAEIAHACIAYLEGGSLDEGGVHLISGEQRFFVTTTWTQDAARIRKSPFLPYAVLNWPEHLRLAYPAQLDLSSKLFAPDSQLRRNWWASMYEATTGWAGDGAPTLPLLHMAAFFDLRAITDQLIQRGDFYSQINKKDSAFQTPLWIAGSRGSIGVFALLLDSGAEQVLLGEPILNLACRKGKLAIVKVLLDRGISANSVELETTLLKGVRLLVRHAPGFLDTLSKNSDETDHEICQLMGRDYGAHFSALHSACCCGHDVVVEFLVDRGANIHHSTSNGWTALHFAAWSGSIMIIQLLLKRGVNVHAATKDKWTAQHFAAYRGKPSALEYLLNLGLPAEAMSRQQKTPLHLASSQGHESAVRTLLDRGANLEARTSKGLTPLHLAAAEGHPPVVMLLLERGANRYATSGSGVTPVKVAKGRHSSEVVALLNTFTAPVARPNFGPQSPLVPPPLNLPAANLAPTFKRYPSLGDVPSIGVPMDTRHQLSPNTIPPLTYTPQNQASPPIQNLKLHSSSAPVHGNAPAPFPPPYIPIAPQYPLPPPTSAGQTPSLSGVPAPPPQSPNTNPTNSTIWVAPQPPPSLPQNHWQTSPRSQGHTSIPLTSPNQALAYGPPPLHTPHEAQNTLSPTVAQTPPTLPQYTSLSFNVPHYSPPPAGGVLQVPNPSAPSANASQLGTPFPQSHIASQTPGPHHSLPIQLPHNTQPSQTQAPPNPHRQTNSYNGTYTPGADPSNNYIAQPHMASPQPIYTTTRSQHMYQAQQQNNLQPYWGAPSPPMFDPPPTSALPPRRGRSWLNLNPFKD